MAPTTQWTAASTRAGPEGRVGVGERDKRGRPSRNTDSDPRPSPDEELCVLAQAEGIVELCRHDACPFWEPGGAALSGGCVLRRAGLDLRRRPELVRLLEDIRRTLDDPETPAAEAEARGALRRLLCFDRDNDPG